MTPQSTRNVVRLFTSLAIALIVGGCAAPAPKTEEETLSRITQLTDQFDRAGEAYFSPDMNWIVFQGVPRGEQNYQMYVAPIRYGESFPPVIEGIELPVRISPAGSKNTCGYFSPDGRSIIFASTAGKASSDSVAGYQRASGTYRWDFPAEMEIYRADGWEAAVRAADPAVGTDLAKHPLTANRAYDAECAYSPDGQWIVFTSRRTGDAELFAMRSDGSAVVQLTDLKGYDGGPFFSPDGKRLMYRSDRAGNDLLQIYVSDVVRDEAGDITGIRNERQLTRDRNVNWGPYWHPDGGHIIYATSTHGHHNYELYLMRDDGSRKTRITFAMGFDGLPVFSPDGKYLMWSSKRTPDDTTQVFIAQFAIPPGR